jgi:murein DD-endopeptidase MepM/ murein hydrolase activator NlpD
MDDRRLYRVVLLLVAFALAGCAEMGAAPTPAPSAQAAAAPTAGPPAQARATAAPSAAPAPSATPAATSTPAASATPRDAPPAAYSYPIGIPGQPPGDGFFIRHGFDAENTWYNPGHWHTGEDWYAIEGDTAGAQVYAIAGGEVVYAGANYPGRVVIVRHADDLYSMYGHLEPKLNVDVGQNLARGNLLGTVLRRGDETPNHLHFEIRTFLTAREVNGAAPRYPFRCGRNCPPGPGYWPIAAPDLPSDRGWRNPTHIINRRMLSEGAAGEVVVASKPVSVSVTLWSAPPGEATPGVLGELDLKAGDHFALLEIYTGAEDTRETSALAYRLWYKIRLLDGKEGWVQAAVPSTFETGGDGRPSSIYFNFLPAVQAAL